MKSGQPSACTRRSKTSSTFFCARYSASKKRLSFLARYNCTTLEIMTDHATMEKTRRQKMMALPSGVACLHTQSNSPSFGVTPTAAKNTGTFIPTRSEYDSANLVVRNRSAQAELDQKTTNQT